MPRGAGDGLITATELYLYVEDRLQTATMAAGRRQTPRLWPLAKHEKGEFAFVVPGRELSLPPAPPLTAEANPWRGLSSYESSDAALFFGREAPAEALQAAVEGQPLVVVLGASGTGKSSLVKAGVLPRLQSDSRWHVLPVLRPGTSPTRRAGTGRGHADTRCSAPTSDGVDPTVARWCDEHPGERLLLVVDQCEELVTMARAASARDAFTALLARLLDAHPLQLTVVLTLRTDFEPQFDRSALGPGWKEARFVVPPMSRADLKAVIEQPASARVLYFDPPALVETLLDDVVNTPGGLPLLSFALSEMFGRYRGPSGGRPGPDRGRLRRDRRSRRCAAGAGRRRVRRARRRPPRGDAAADAANGQRQPPAAW